MLSQIVVLRQLLQTLLPAETSEVQAQGASAENLQKNRFPHLLPGMCVVAFNLVFEVSKMLLMMLDDDDDDSK